MTEVWFYVSDDDAADARARLLQRLLERAVRSDRQLYLHGRDAAAVDRLDQWLWRLPGFLPHARLEDTEAQASPVVLGSGDDPGEQHDVLVNLDDDVPDFFSRFQRVVELVTGDKNERQKSRERWKFYRDRGYPVTRHELG